MEGWQQDWLKTLETVANEVGQFFEGVSRELIEATDALFELSEEVAEEVESAVAQLDEALAPKFDQLDDQMAEWLDPFLEAIFGFEATLDRAVEPVTHTVEPLLNQHPLCVGCRHYHGQSYGGNLLVCAMHPYGMVDGSDHCPDKELFSWHLPHPSFNSSEDEL